MKLAIQLFGALIILAGISLLINPEIIFGWIEGNIERTWMYISAIVVRLIFGPIFILAAKDSKYPSVIKFFGYLSIIVAIVFILIGHANFQEFFSSVIPMLKSYALLSALIDIAIGSFLIYAFTNSGAKIV